MTTYSDKPIYGVIFDMDGETTLFSSLKATAVSNFLT